jgi:tetratricopeptide (TPR) repeat protein
MGWSFQQIGNWILTGLAIVAISVFVVMLFLRAHEKKVMLIRLGITLGLAAAFYIMVVPMLLSHSVATAAAVFVTAVFGWIFAIIWVPAITGYCGRVVGSLIDGGDAEVEPKPFYSIFRSLRLKGKYYEALAEVRRQLEKFPNDFEGHMLLAELQAENLNDLPGAAVTVQRASDLPEQLSQNIAYAYNKLADWHLSLMKDRDSARETLEVLIARFRDTEIAARAAQRIAHLADTGMLLASHDRQRIDVKKGVENLGLIRGANGRLRAPETDYEKLAEEYAQHLEKHPLDTHAREQLAVILAKNYQRLDMATEQLEYLIQQPSHSAKQVAHWLNVLADLQVRGGADEELTRATLQRIIDAYPDSGAAENARRRMDRLKLEFKGQEKKRDVQMGTYEQNLGLKRSGARK